MNVNALESFRNPRRNRRLVRRGMWSLAVFNLTITLVFAFTLANKGDQAEDESQPTATSTFTASSTE